MFSSSLISLFSLRILLSKRSPALRISIPFEKSLNVAMLLRVYLPYCIQCGSLAFSWVLCVLYFRSMTEAQRKQYEEARKRALAYKANNADRYVLVLGRR